MHSGVVVVVVVVVVAVAGQESWVSPRVAFINAMGKNKPERRTIPQFNP
jgi:hypothetical protein